MHFISRILGLGLVYTFEIMEYGTKAQIAAAWGACAKKNEYFQYDTLLIYTFALRSGSAPLHRNSTLPFRAIISNCTFALHFCSMILICALTLYFCLALLFCLFCTLAHLCTALL